MKGPRFFTTVLIVLACFCILFFLRVTLLPKKHSSDFGYDVSVVPGETITAETFLTLGKQQAAKGELEGAISYYQLGLQNFEDNIPLLMALGNTYETIEEVKKAIDIFISVAKLQPEDATIRYKIATLFYDQGEYQEASKYIKYALALTPQDDRFLNFAAQVSNLNENYKEAYGYFDKLSPHYLPEQALTFAKIKTSSWAKHSKEDRSKELLNHAKIALEKNNLHQSQEDFYQYEILFGKTKTYQYFLTEHIYQDMLKKNPQDAETNYQLAQFYYQTDRLKEALEAIDKALSIKKTNLSYLQLKAIIANELNLIEAEKEAYLTILSVTPNNKMVVKELAILALLQQVNVTKRQIEADPLLLQIAQEEYRGDHLAAFATLKKYKKEEGNNPIYQAMLSFLAFKLDKCTLQKIEEQAELKELLVEFSLAGTAKKDDSWLFQDKAHLVAEKLVCDEPCREENYDLYASALRLLEDPPLVDLIAARAAYCRMLALDPCNQKAFYNLARVTALLLEVDHAEKLYRRYLLLFPPDRNTLIEYADLLEDQGNIGRALKYICLCAKLYGLDTYIKEKIAHICNSGALSTPALPIALELLREDPDNYNAWLDYTNATGILNYPYRSLYGLNQLLSREPGNPETKSAQWTVLPQLLSYINPSAEYYSETTSLTQYFERLEGGLALSPTTKVTAGIELFETHAADVVNLVLGLGDLQGINGEAWGGEGCLWVGLHKWLSPYLIVDLHLGGADQHVGDIHSGTPTYFANFFMPISDCLEVNFLSSYGFLLKSPRSLSLKIRQERNFLSCDWRPWWGYQLISTFDGMINTDGNKQLEIYLYPRKTVCYKQHWKIDLGLMGTWLTSHKSRLTGYYQPYLYQGYAVELLVDYRFNYFNTLKVNGSLGAQKDNFNDSFGLLTNLKSEGLFNLSLHWYVYFSTDYYHIDTSEGPFSYVDFAGGVIYRF